MTAEKKQILTVKNIRTVNIENILQTIIRKENSTRSTLAKENHISLMTVKHVADDLIAAHILTEQETDGSEVGRKPKLLALAERYGNIVCVNLTSQAEITYLIYDIYENLLEEQSISLESGCSYQEALMMTIGILKERLSAMETETVGIAVFIPSAYDDEADQVNYDLIPAFKGLRLRELFEKEFEQKNVLILHDVVAAARSEYVSLPSKQESQFYFYCGYGVGGYFIHQDQAVTGEQQMAGEVGKMLVNMDGESARGISFEDVVSISAVKTRMKELGVEMNFTQLLECYEQGEEIAQKILEPVLTTVSKVLYNLLWVYNPTKVVIDSCKDHYSQLMVNHFQEFLKEMHNDAIPIRTEVCMARYDEYHQMRGCFYMTRNAWIEEIARML